MNILNIKVLYYLFFIFAISSCTFVQDSSYDDEIEFPEIENIEFTLFNSSVDSNYNINLGSIIFKNNSSNNYFYDDEIINIMYYRFFQDKETLDYILLYDSLSNTLFIDLFKNKFNTIGCKSSRNIIYSNSKVNIKLEYNIKNNSVVFITPKTHNYFDSINIKDYTNLSKLKVKKPKVVIRMEVSNYISYSKFDKNPKDIRIESELE